MGSWLYGVATKRSEHVAVGNCTNWTELVSVIYSHKRFFHSSCCISVGERFEALALFVWHSSRDMARHGSESSRGDGVDQCMKQICCAEYHVMSQHFKYEWNVRTRISPISMFLDDIANNSTQLHYDRPSSTKCVVTSNGINYSEFDVKITTTKSRL